MPSRRLLNFRPLACCAAALCIGIFLADRLSGTGQLIALCCFSLCGFFALYFKRRACALFALFLAAGFLRVFLATVLPPFSLPFEDFFSGIKSALCDMTDGLFGASSPALSAMLWGVKSKGEITEAFRDTGIAHVFALSGLHVSFFVGAMALLIRRRRVRFIATAAFLLCYCAVTAFPASLVRAAVMSLCLLSGRLRGRPGDTLSSLSFAALVILLIAPRQLFEIGFQLSFMAVLTIAMLGDPLSRLLSPLGKAGADSLSLALCGTLGTLPLSVFYFHRLSLLSVFSNLLLLPCVPVAVLGAFCAVLLGFISPVLAFLPRVVAAFFTDVLIKVTGLIASLPFCTVQTGSFSPWACVFFYLMLFALSRYPLISRRARLCAAGALLSLSFAFYLLP